MTAAAVNDLRVTLDRLRRTRAETVAMFDALEAEHDAAARRCKQVSENVDMAAFLATVFVSLGKLAAGAHKAMRLEGAALERHNKAVVGKFLKEKAERDGTLVANAVMADVREGDAMLMGKAALKAYGDFQSPSFWAAAYTDIAGSRRLTWDPVRWGSFAESVGREGRERIRAVRQQSLRNLDQKIRKYEALIATLRKREPA